MLKLGKRRHQVDSLSAGRAQQQRELQRLIPLDQLGPEALDELHRKAHFAELASGKRLFAERSENGRILYLLEGQLEISDGNGSITTLVGGSEEARHPLTTESPRPAIARTMVRYVAFDADLLDVLSAPTEASPAVDEILADDDVVENRVFYQIYSDYMEDKLEVPSLPDLAVRIREAVSDADADIEEIAKMIVVDPSVVAHLVRIANSALYGGLPPVSDVRDAVIRLGLTVTRDQVTAHTLRNLFDTQNKDLSRRMRELWKHTCLVGAISYVLARLTPGINPGRALLAGLVHDIGSLVLLRQAASHPELLSKPAELDATIDKLKGQVGAMVLRKWGFPDDMATVALEVETWTRDSGSKADLCDIVILAKLHSYIGTPRMHDLPGLTEVPAITKLASGELTPQFSLKVVEEAREEVADIQRTLTG